MVMMRVIKDLRGDNYHARHSQHDLLKSSALNWVKFSGYYIGSFPYVCEALNLDQGLTRKRLIRIAEKKRCHKDREGNSNSQMQD